MRKRQIAKAKQVYSMLDEMMASPTEPLAQEKRQYQLLRMYEGLRALEIAPEPSTEALSQPCLPEGSARSAPSSISSWMRPGVPTTMAAPRSSTRRSARCAGRMAAAPMMKPAW